MMLKHSCFKWHFLMAYILLFAMLPSVIGASQIGGDFQLTDHNGKPFLLENLRGKVVLISFGYTFCPDICPTELSKIARILNGLGEHASSVQALFISLDPKRDTPERLKDYVKYFYADLIGLTGRADEIKAVANAYRVKYAVYNPEDEFYTVDHSANLYIVGPRGTLEMIVPNGLPEEHVREVIGQLLP